MRPNKIGENMLDDLRKKTEDLVSTVYALGVASRSIEEVELAEIEPELAGELDAVDARMQTISQQITELSGDKAASKPAAEIASKIDKIIDETDALDSQILAIPRPRNRIGRPKYYERLRIIIAKIEQMTQQIATVQERLSAAGRLPFDEGEFGDDRPPRDVIDDEFDETRPIDQ